MATIHGQPRATAVINAYLRSPESRAFLLHGPTGTGKTTSAHNLADALGVVRSPIGGFDEIPAGEQSAEAVRALALTFRLRPMQGDWRMIVVNECDSMSPQAEKIWLDVLEHLPPRVVICFTTNAIEKLSARFVDRCRSIEFVANARSLAEFVALEWARLMPGVAFPDVLASAGLRPNLPPSYRRAVNDIEEAIAMHGEEIPLANSALDPRHWILTDGRAVWGCFRADEEIEARAMQTALVREMGGTILLARAVDKLARGAALPNTVSIVA